MEIFFSSNFATFEAIVLMIFGGGAFIILSTYAYAYIARIIQIFGPKKRDAILAVRDEDVLKKRDESAEGDNQDSQNSEELPPPITVEEIEEVTNVESQTISGDTEEVTIPSPEDTIIEAEKANEETLEKKDSDNTQDKETNTEEVTEIKENNKETENEINTEEATTITEIDAENEKNEDIVELENPENAHKTFDELEKESDKAFEEQNPEEKETSEAIEDTEKSEDNQEKKEAEEVEEKELSETEELLQKSSENIQNIIESTEKEEDDNTMKLMDMTNASKSLISRGMIAEARSMIIEGLSLQKNHKELNLLLGEIFEKEQNFEKAKIIYRDLALEHTEDLQILQKLANMLIIFKEWTIAYELYKKILTLDNGAENTLYMLVNIAKEIEDFSDVYKYSCQYAEKWPNNKDILASLSEAQIRLGKRKEAIETLIKLKNLSPYEANEIQQYIEQLVTEENQVQTPEK